MRTKTKSVYGNKFLLAYFLYAAIIWYALGGWPLLLLATPVNVMLLMVIEIAQVVRMTP